MKFPRSVQCRFRRPLNDPIDLNDCRACTIVAPACVCHFTPCRGEFTHWTGGLKSMFDAFIDGLFLVLQWKAFSLMLVGMGLGFCVGLLPGIGGGGYARLDDPVRFQDESGGSVRFLARHALSSRDHR